MCLDVSAWAIKFPDSVQMLFWHLLLCCRRRTGAWTWPGLIGRPAGTPSSPTSRAWAPSPPRSPRAQTRRPPRAGGAVGVARAGTRGRSRPRPRPPTLARPASGHVTGHVEAPALAPELRPRPRGTVSGARRPRLTASSSTGTRGARRWSIKWTGTRRLSSQNTRRTEVTTMTSTRSRACDARSHRRPGVFQIKCVKCRVSSELVTSQVTQSELCPDKNSFKRPKFWLFSSFFQFVQRNHQYLLLCGDERSAVSNSRVKWSIPHPTSSIPDHAGIYQILFICLFGMLSLKDNNIEYIQKQWLDRFHHAMQLYIYGQCFPSYFFSLIIVFRK